MLDGLNRILLGGWSGRQDIERGDEEWDWILRVENVCYTDPAGFFAKTGLRWPRTAQKFGAECRRG